MALFLVVKNLTIPEEVVLLIMYSLERDVPVVPGWCIDGKGTCSN